MLVIITKCHTPPLPPLHLIAKLPEQLQAGFLVQQGRPLLGHLQQLHMLAMHTHS